MANEAPVTLEQLFRFYRGLPHQAAAIQILEQDLAVNGYAAAMRRDRAWFNIWSQDGKQADLAAALKLIKDFEGCHLEAYPDPLSGGDPWTIGYGTTRYQDGRRVSRGDKINAIEADLLLRREVDRIAEKLRATVPYWVQMADNQKCALISFAYNLGSGFYGTTGFETISRELREKDWPAVPDALLLYRNPGSNVEAGLKRRRIAEGTLWAGTKPQPQRAATVRLKVPYEYQRDNASGQGNRECFSSSCAMVARFYGKVANDDAYNKIRARFGDTTDSQAQVKALHSLGLKATFTQSGDEAMLERELRAGRPVAVGWLHHGPASAPSGGGHWSVIVGMTPEAFVHNDPYGEADMTQGGYVSAKGGDGINYSRKNWMRRWRVNGTSGWAILVQPG
jgi:GH24 family phage-related lysozyme (muramidase)